MASVLKVQLETDRPGLVPVRAKPAPGHELDGRPIGGFYIRRRWAGEQFAINDWREFSPRWMEFVDETAVPKDWWDKLKIREEERAAFIAKAEDENKKTALDHMRDQTFSMLQAANPTVVEMDGNGKTRPRRSPNQSEI